MHDICEGCGAKWVRKPDEPRLRKRFHKLTCPVWQALRRGDR